MLSVSTGHRNLQLETFPDAFGKRVEVKCVYNGDERVAQLRPVLLSVHDTVCVRARARASECVCQFLFLVQNMNHL